MFGNLDEEIGLILNKNIIWIPITLLSLIFLLVIVENIFQYSLLRFLYLAVALLSVILLLNDGFATSNASAWLFGLIYFPFLLIRILIKKNRNENKLRKMLSEVSKQYN